MLSIAVGGIIFGIHTATLHHSLISKYIGRDSEVLISAVVTTEPKQQRERVRGSHLQPGKVSFLARTVTLKIDDNNFYVRVPIRVLSSTKTNVIPGDKILVKGDLIQSSEKRVAAILIASENVELYSQAHAYKKFLAAIRAKYRQELAKFGDEAGALIPGMIIGDTTLQTSGFTDQMKRAGLSHLTAVSGANFAIVSSLVFYLFRRVIPRIIPRVIVTAGFLTLFLLLVRPSPSVLRAGVMAAVILAARASGNSQNSIAALATAISVLLLVDPFQALDPGFILSVLATSGLLFIAPHLSRRFARHMPDSVAEMVAVPCAATIACTPYILVLSGEVSALSIFFNVVVAPVVAPITILGFLALLLMPLGILHTVLIWPAHLLATWITRVASWSEASPTLGVNPIALIVSVILGYLAFLKFGLRSLYIITFLIFGLVLIPQLMFPGSNWRIVQCDVGQGDALLLNLGGGDAVLFDAGPDPRALSKCLKRARIKRLPLIIISHGHADHYFGAQGLSSRFEVGEIWGNGNPQISAALESEILNIRQGMSASIAGISIEILWPNEENKTFQSLGGDGSQENNQSIVALVKWNGAQILITGDIEPEVQARLTHDNDLSDVDILKVPHHGSRFQDQEFLEAISPEVALVSVGAGNSYGHPNVELLKTLQSIGARVFRTDQDGPISVAWRFDDRATRYIFTTRTMRKEWWPIQWL